MQKIKIILQGNNYVAWHSDKEVERVFGTPIIPTPFTSSTPPSEVLEKIRALNPDCLVTMN